MSLVEGLSHITLATSAIEKYEQCVEFYSTFGFQTISQTVPPKSSIEMVQNKSQQEKLLHLFAKPPATPITLKIVLSKNATIKVAVPEDKDWRLEPVSIAIVSKNIESVISILDSSNLCYKKYTYPGFDHSYHLEVSPDLVHIEIYTHDPLNNLICFSNKPFPFDKTLYPISPATPSMISPPDNKPKFTKKRIGLLTSGGDSSGMNAAVRSIVRVAISRGCEAYAIYEGYEGLVQGGDMIKKFSWSDVRGYLSIGGTLIRTARCQSFREHKGRLEAAYNLIKNGIDALIVCGGDGTLTGADTLRSEWSDLTKELVQTGKLTAEEVAPHTNLTIVGIVCSIDNDMAKTDITIGAVTSLHRICEAVDSISSTAFSHSRAFVIEVMGRHCGWLALMAAISTGADYVFIPERPPEAKKWKKEMLESLERQREAGKRNTIIIVAEGAIDDNLDPIKCDDIKRLLLDAKIDTRVTTLGHIQRGGRPCVYDRNLATLQGVEAVEAVLRATPDTPSPMISVRESKIMSEPLMEAVELTHQVTEAIAEKNFRRAMELRDPEFAQGFDAYLSTAYMENKASLQGNHSLRIGIIHIGAPAGGMNAATRAAVRVAINHGHKPIAIYNGFSGLLQENVRELNWLDVDDWTSKGGSELGTNKAEADNLGLIAYQLQKQGINALLLIGGFEAYTSLIKLNDARNKYPAFCIPMVCIPATISNNVPGTEFSLGCDTSLNAIVDSCDAIKQSASASRRRVFVVEVQGGHCGYLAVMAGLAVGATNIYAPEYGLSLETLQGDVNHLVRRFGADKKSTSSGRLFLRNESVSNTYTTNVIANIIKTEGKGLFDSRTSILGHIQQGGAPSPMDRIRAKKFAVECVSFLEKHAKFSGSSGNSKYPKVYTNDKESAAVIGINGAQVVCTPVTDLQSDTDFECRKSKKAWWINVKPLVELLSKWGYSDNEPIEEEMNICGDSIGLE